MFSKNSQIVPNTITQLIQKLGSLLYSYNLVIDSRKVDSDSIFCAYPGQLSDGRTYISDAIKAGAKFVLWEDGIKFEHNIPNYCVNNLMLYIGLLASAKYNYPSQNFTTIGVTGTNGKTSITWWLNQIYSLSNKKTGIIGTTGAGIYPKVIDFGLTTPNPIDLQSILYDFMQHEVEVVALEVSSHSLHQGRVNGINFTTAIFTNLTQDHLDYHKSMENYYLAKRELFFWKDLKNAIINTDDIYGLRLFNELKDSGINILTYGIDSGQINAKNIVINLSGMSFDLNYNNQTIRCLVSIIGKFNIYNLLAVVAALLIDGYTLFDIPQMLSKLVTVSGRMETIVLPNKPLVVVDYSHTPDSLHNALTTLSGLDGRGDLYCVFGCGGNRDKTKRPIMGKIATTLANYTVITTDNPRFEDSKDIIQQIVMGVNGNNYKVIENREDAIKYVLAIAKANDIVLISGKGHETYQEIKGIKTYFSDFELALKLLED